MVAINKFIKNFGWARIIIAIFLLTLFVVAPVFGVRVDQSINDVLVRFGMNAIMVLSMVPMIHWSSRSTRNINSICNRFIFCSYIWIPIWHAFE